jgi:hypothetical protein
VLDENNAQVTSDTFLSDIDKQSNDQIVDSDVKIGIL